MSNQSCNSGEGSQEQPLRRFAVAARRWHGIHLVDHFSTPDRANVALSENMDRHPLFVTEADIWIATNGNIRMWKSVKNVAQI